MIEILALLQTIAPLIEKTTYRQLSQVVLGMLAINGRITMLGLARWSEKGGSYRTMQRFYQGELPWKALQWLFFWKCLWQPADEYIIAGDEVVVSKAGKKNVWTGSFFFRAATTGDTGSVVFRFVLGECVRREILPATGQPDCQKC